MTSSEKILKALRSAVQISPDNAPLHQHLADTLMSFGQTEEAATEYDYALALLPNSQELKLKLAQAFYQQGKHSQAIVLVEELLKSPEASAQSHLLYAKLLLDLGNTKQACDRYRRAIQMDSTFLADPILAARFGTALRSPVFGNPESEFVLPTDRPTITFNDVGGMDEFKEELRLKIVYPLAHSELYQAYGKTIGGGVLLYGPPGCGKTFLARATAGEIKAQFLAIGINDVLDMWLGNSEKNLHAIFEQARRNAPCVLFFDEVDALAARRRDMQGSAGRQLINFWRKWTGYKPLMKGF